jgi:Rrf2 family nitric oxide-sensitive transcriptional repressor
MNGSSSWLSIVTSNHSPRRTRSGGDGSEPLISQPGAITPPPMSASPGAADTPAVESRRNSLRLIPPLKSAASAAPPVSGKIGMSNTYYTLCGGMQAGNTGACSSASNTLEAAMRLTHFTDYSLRTLIYLGLHRDRLVSVAEVAKGYGISYHHLVKVSALLVDLGVVEAVRGRSGGVRLAVAPAEINVGWLVRRTEPDFHIVECFDESRNTCPISRICKLQHVLDDAQQQFMAVLDGYTLANFLEGEERALGAAMLVRPSRRKAAKRSAVRN